MAAIDDCPECGKALQVPEAEVGRRVACPRCNRQFVARGTATDRPRPVESEPEPAARERRRREDEDDRPGRAGRKYCSECGAEISKRDRYCPGCDAKQPKSRDPALADAANKKVAAGLCAILVGSLGVHKFILGYTTAGVIMLVIFLATCGVGAAVMHVISIIEGITYLTKSDEDFYETYIVGKKEWF
jgi:TM2 domain-containing membrane protein YozV/DNA-directed RNA polymerase subunit M/transcription elongation factor TFIIS